ncbi:sigma-54-dependent Fis family transcriptional regulator [Rhodophyticola sp. CCM32]|uniref:sigma-54-dependent transcriptional regulator n=1 Tax=Rhodophyticola sp. CCM32 TaxID=2916397 RepID=UPI00107EF9B3|nr:sigma-54 dependent transcriptional regulator [Rhodophyticola sp. CCM32]QBX99799.1 sigma-54-dependent Fis family transcriptional regulator [Rhodophyticola sp. CCM32]
MKQSVILVDDEEELRNAAGQTLLLADLPADIFARAEDALARISRGFAGVLVTDIRMPDRDGLWLMQRVLEIDPEFPVILVTGHGDVDLAVTSMRDGAYDFIEKPFAPARLVSTIRRGLEKRRLTLENRSLKREVGGRDKLEARLVGRSDAIVTLRKTIRTIAATDADVLITGPTGAGKDMTARALHDLSPRARHPFVHINCAALPVELVETELFGHEAGAFAGAVRARFGKFEYARQGTVFLDEIDSLSVPVQAKLLHAIQERQITRLGSNDPVTLDIRVIAAAKSDLPAAVETGAFRADLLYRLNVVTIDVPSLKARRDDVPSLFLNLAAQAAARYSKPMPDVPASVLLQLATRDWPGNVRELRNTADRFVLGFDQIAEVTPETEAPQTSLAQQMAAHERSLILAALVANDGQLKPTYEALNLSRKALYEKMQKHGLSKADADR